MNVVAYILLAIGIWLSAMNWWSLIYSWSGKGHSSPVPLIPFIATLLGLRLLEPTRPYWWAAFLIDPSLLTLLAAIPRWVADAWHTSRFTRIQSLRADQPPRHFELALHRNGHFVLRAVCAPPIPCNSHGATISGFGLVGRWQDVDGRLRLSGYQGDRVLTLERMDAGYVAREACYPAGNEFPYDSLDGLAFGTAGPLRGTSQAG